MTEHGRGAWNNSGAGGTKAFKDATRPGPYYYLGSGQWQDTSDDTYAVHHAVKAYQRALNRRLGVAWDLSVTGFYTPPMVDAVTQFQKKHSDELTVWGGIGPDTSRLLLYPDLVATVNKKGHAPLTSEVVSGLIRHESSWDAGAVGYVDPHDLGLAQINGPAHPQLSKAERLRPVVAFEFVVSYMNNALTDLSGNLRDAIASYNLGLGGVQDWINQGRPQMFTPRGNTSARDLWAYIDSVLEG
jgi:hypothetical protein